MKRVIYALAGLTAVIVLGIVVWNTFRIPAGGVEPSIEAAANGNQGIAVNDGGGETAVSPSTNAPEQEDEIETIENAPQAEEIVAVEPETFHNAVTESAAAMDMAIGRGGGGYGYGGEGPFTNATISLNAELPQASDAPVYVVPFQNEPVDFDAEMLRTFADKMGVSGDIYFEWYHGMPLTGQDDGTGNVPYMYRIFEGTRNASAYLGGELIYEDSSLYSINMSPLPYDERSAIAEQFLLERNLLDFEYEMHSGWGTEVQFLPVVDSRTVHNWSQITVQVTGDGQILMVSLRPLTNLTELQVESLRSAADAWQYLQDNFASSPMMYNIFPSNPEYFMPPQPTGQKTHWEREFAVGQEVNVMSWVQIYRPYDGNGALRLTTDRGMILAADDATLEAIADAVAFGNNIRLQGTIAGEPDKMELNVTDWEPISGLFEIYLNGTTRDVNGVVSLELPGGFPIQIANPPADLPLDTSIGMSSWSVRVADDGVSAIADWNFIDLMNFDYYEPEPYYEDPYVDISSVVINDVQLVYQYLYPYEPLEYHSGDSYIDNDNSHLVPVWRFAGETNKGDRVEFMIAAPANVDLPVVETD